MSTARQKILIVEDDSDVADMLDAYFSVQGFEVLTLKWGGDGVRACQAARPDLVILDIHLPDIDGFEVARQLHADRRTANIPIIFLTERTERLQQLQWLELGGDEYMAKPFDVQELRLRVHKALQRNKQDDSTNVVTGLAEGIPVDDFLIDCLKKTDWVMLRISVENMDTFSDIYGLTASNEALRAIGQMVRNTMQESGGVGDFLGHLNASTFVLITSPEKISALREILASRLNQSLEYFYPIKDRDQYALKGNRLNARIKVLLPTDGTFTSLESLKSALIGRE